MFGFLYRWFLVVVGLWISCTQTQTLANFFPFCTACLAVTKVRGAGDVLEGGADGILFEYEGSLWESVVLVDAAASVDPFRTHVLHVFWSVFHQQIEVDILFSWKLLSYLSLIKSSFVHRININCSLEPACEPICVTFVVIAYQKLCCQRWGVLRWWWLPLWLASFQVCFRTKEWGNHRRCKLDDREEYLIGFSTLFQAHFLHWLRVFSSTSYLFQTKRSDGGGTLVIGYYDYHVTTLSFACFISFQHEKRARDYLRPHLQYNCIVNKV